MGMLQIVLIALMVLIGTWSLVLLVSTIKMMKQVKTARGFNRRTDLWQVLSLLFTFLGSAGILLLDADFIKSHPATVSGLILGILFALFYVHQRQRFHCDRIKELFTKKQP